MPHIKRAIVLLLLILVAVFVLPRVLPVPALMVDFGFHTVNQKQNAEQWAAVPVSFASTSICADCHQNNYKLWQSGNHRVVSCENCHGPATKHIAEGAPVQMNISREFCGTCHAKVVSRPADFPQVDMKTMGGEALCTTCHNPHEPRAGMPPEVPHSLEGRSSCQSCHNPQAHEPYQAPPPQAPHVIEGREDCLACHGPTGIRGASLPHVPTGLAGTNCLLCHTTGAVKPLPNDHVGRTSATCTNCHRLN